MMGERQQRWIGAGLLAGLGLLTLLVLLWQRDDPAPQPSSVSPATAPPSPATAESAAAAPGPRAAELPAPPSPATFGEDATARAGALEGRVVCQVTGDPVANAELVFAHQGAAIGVSSRDDGSFGFAPHAPGAYELAAVTAEGYLPFAPAWGQSPIRFVARPGERISGVVVSLIPAVDYTGQVIDPEGRAVAGATVFLRAASRDFVLDGVPTEFETDAAGEFIFHAPDYALFEARHSDFAPGRARLDFAAQVSHRLVIQLRPPDRAAPRGTIAGRVVDPEGAPAADATVVIPGGRAPVAITLSDVEGRFTFVELSGGPHRVVASLAGFAPASVDRVALGKRDLELRLGRGQLLSGEVTDESSGGPIPAFSVWLGRREGPMAIHSYTSRAVYDSAGRFEIPGLEPGAYRVAVSARGYAPTIRDDVTITAAQRTHVELALGRGGELTGTVVSAESREPIANAAVSLEGMMGRGSGPTLVVARANSGADGSFHLQGIAPGERSITVAATGHHGQIVGRLPIEADRDAGPITVALTPLAEGEKPSLELAGIGAALGVAGEVLVIQHVIAGGGAVESGLVAGDAIISVDGVPVTELGFEGSIQRIRGPVGTVVRLGVKKRDGTLIELPVVRRKIRA